MSKPRRYVQHVRVRADIRGDQLVIDRFVEMVVAEQFRPPAGYAVTGEVRGEFLPVLLDCDVDLNGPFYGVVRLEADLIGAS